jgi:hypothetical protein
MIIKFIALIASACALAAGADPAAHMNLKLRGSGGEEGGGVNVQVSSDGKAVIEAVDELVSGGWCSGHIDKNDQHELPMSSVNEDHDWLPPYSGSYYRVIRAGALCDPANSPSGPITNDQCQSGTGTQCLPIGNGLKCCVIPKGGACKSGAEYCQPPNKCVNGECGTIPAPAPPAPKPQPMPTQRRNPTYIPAGGICNVGGTPCITGYSCVGGKCAIIPKVIPAGGICIVGGTPCITGYSCVGGRCAIPYVIPSYIPAGGICIVGGTPCITGYSCVNGICIIWQSEPMPTCGVSLIIFC